MTWVRLYKVKTSSVIILLYTHIFFWQFCHNRALVVIYYLSGKIFTLKILPVYFFGQIPVLGTDSIQFSVEQLCPVQYNTLVKYSVISTMQRNCTLQYKYK